YNYGYNAAVDAYGYANGLGVRSPVWWLDVESPSQLWSADTAANARVVAGAADALNALGVEPGVYSNSYQWPQIVGDYSPELPMWQARPTPDNSVGEANAYCGPSYAFTSGPTWLEQWGQSTWDQDYAC
ncbi:MAG TPA: hypothetical protein VFH45_06915, partial [Acidimicrobiales bacterium]|nr:hypothetical protein [Acidimicrobiales bacterium]